MRISRAMRLSILLATASTAVFPIAQGQYASPSANATLIYDEISQIPACGLTCLQGTIRAAGCSLLNTTCQCENPEFMTATSNCMFANCTLADSFILSKIQAAICRRPYETRNPEVRILTVVCTVISNTATILRLAVRYFLHQPLGADDWFILAAVFADSGFVYCGIKAVNSGFGEHIWNIDLVAIPSVFYWFYFLELLYGLTLGLVKVSILLFYLRVFPVKSVRLASWAMIAYCGASFVAFSLVTIFRCKPIAYAWDKNIQGGSCINYKAVALAYAAIDIQQDILIIILPISALLKLQLCLKKKISMYAMFGVGSVVCLTSIIRLNSLRNFSLTADPTWNNISMASWSSLQTTAAILCACMPAIRAGLVRLWSRIMTEFRRTSTDDAHSTVGESQPVVRGVNSPNSNLNISTAASLASSARTGAASISSPVVFSGMLNGFDGYKSDMEATKIVSGFFSNTVNDEKRNLESEIRGRAFTSWGNTSRTTPAENVGAEMLQRQLPLSIFNPDRDLEGGSFDTAKPLPPLPLTPPSAGRMTVNIETKQRSGR